MLKGDSKSRLSVRKGYSFFVSQCLKGTLFPLTQLLQSFLFFLFFRLLRTTFWYIREMVDDDAMDADNAGGATALGVGAAGTGTASTAKRKIEVKKWNAVAVWSWSTSFDSCAICRNTLHEPSIEFQANSQQEGADGLSIAVRLRIICVYCRLFYFRLFASRGARFRSRVFDSS